MRKILFIIFVLLFNSTFLFAQKENYNTYNFTTYNDDILALDFYASRSNNKKCPTILFVHGGSFMNGSKNSAYVEPFAKKFTEAGYNVISIDYRLTLKGKSFHCDCPSSEKIKTFEHAVYDIRAATKYILNHDKELHVNTKQIVLAGNSAGAEAILHAAFWANDRHNIGEQVLENKFKYAGILAYAGAIIDTTLITSKNSIPIGLYHGTCDQYVPYKTAKHHYCADSTIGALPLSGSYDIMKRYKNLDKSYFLYSLCYGNHDVNVISLDTQIDNTIQFVNETVLGKNKKQQHIIEQSSLEKCKFVKTDFCR